MLHYVPPSPPTLSNLPSVRPVICSQSAPLLSLLNPIKLLQSPDGQPASQVRPWVMTKLEHVDPPPDIHLTGLCFNTLCLQQGRLMWGCLSGLISGWLGG